MGHELLWLDMVEATLVNMRMMGRTVARLPAVMPKLASTFDQTEIWVVASECV
jgi:hypothetical protein